LDELYGDVPRILCLQDWYAVIGMVYEVITGETLFHQTGKMIIGIKTALFKHVDSQRTRQELYKKAGRMFWHNASTEITEKMKDKRNILNAVQVVLPDSAKQMFRQALHRQQKHTGNKIKHYVLNQRVFKGEKNCKALIGASRRKITELKLNMEKGQKHKTPGYSVLKGLEKVKQKAENQSQRIELFGQETVIITAYDLMDTMFEIVMDEMHRIEWGELLAAEVVGVKGGANSTTIDATV